MADEPTQAATAAAVQTVAETAASEAARETAAAIEHRVTTTEAEADATVTAAETAVALANASAAAAELDAAERTRLFMEDFTQWRNGIVETLTTLAGRQEAAEQSYQAELNSLRQEAGSLREQLSSILPRLPPEQPETIATTDPETGAVAEVAPVAQQTVRRVRRLI